MSSFIRVSPNQLRVTANSIEKKLEEAKLCLGQVVTQVDITKSGWEGKSAETYIEEFKNVKIPLTKKLEDSLSNLALSLRTVANEIERADQEIARALSKQLKP